MTILSAIWTWHLNLDTYRRRERDWSKSLVLAFVVVRQSLGLDNQALGSDKLDDYHFDLFSNHIRITLENK